jgi:hypothetical protein
MTQLLEHAIGKVRSLPPDEQDAIASLILEEIADDARWTEAFARSQDVLGRLASEARADITAGRVRDCGMDEL